MAKQLKKVIYDRYNLEVRKTDKLEGGFRNQCFKIVAEHEKYVFIIYKKQKGIVENIHAAHLAARILHEKGFCVRMPVLTRQGKEYFKWKFDNGFYCCALYNFLVGETISWEAYTRRHLKSMGKTLSDMHYASREYCLKKQVQYSNICFDKLPDWGCGIRQEIAAMKKYFERVEVWIERKLCVKLQWQKIDFLFGRIREQSYKDTEPDNVLHYDLVRGNILFSDKLDKDLDVYPIIGILDFEKACRGPEIADIARTLAFLIIDCKYKQEEVVRKRFLYSGYEKRGANKLPSQCRESSILENLLIFFWLKDFWKFLEHNPYEFLYMNEHYLRTRDRLLESGVLLRMKNAEERSRCLKCSERRRMEIGSGLGRSDVYPANGGAPKLRDGEM